MEDNIVQGYKCSSNSVDVFGFDHILVASYSDQNPVNGLLLGDPISNNHELAFHPNSADLGLFSEEGNVCDAVLKYISNMLMEDEDLENSRPGVFQDSLALQEAEKSLYDLLGEKYPPSPNRSPGDDFIRTFSSHSGNSSTSVNKNIDSNFVGDWKKFGSTVVYNNFNYVVKSDLKIFGSLSGFCDAVDGTLDSVVNGFQVLDPSKESKIISQFGGRERKVIPILPKVEYENYDLGQKEKPQKQDENNWTKHSSSLSRGKKSHYREDGDYLEANRSKQLASYADDSDEHSEMYDKVLLCPTLNTHLHKEESLACLFDESLQNGVGGKKQMNGKSRGSSGGKPRTKKQGNRRAVVDLTTLLSQCAQAVCNDIKNANELLKQIRRHSSPLGDGTERMAHYLANALEARLAGTGRALDASLLTERLSASDTLKAYHAFLTACPFQKMSNFFANKMIWKLAEKATRIHIIDFGIIHGFQWPHLIHNLSLRPGGPPRVRITGIDFPQPGFRPAKRVEETGHRLAYYCERFNVPFEYNGVAKKWDTIQLEDLKIHRDEVLIVNCLYRLRYVTDETVDMNCPRDVILNLIKRINPDLFIHGVANGTYNGPFFISRFREVLFLSYAVFDMFDAVLPLEDQGRMLYEQEVLGRGLISVIACEGTERVIRPETYKQWQIRNIRAGLRQLPLDQEIKEYVRAKVTLGYHKDFVVDEDSNWLLQGWKGRILYALSCWKPA